MNSPLISLFKEQLENELKTIATDYALSKRGDFLIWWYFSKLIGLIQSKIEEVVCDGAADLGIDAIRIDESSTVHFYSFKNPESINAAYPAGEIDKTLAGLNIILARKHQDIANEDLRGRVEEIYQTVPTGYRLHLVTSGMGISDESRTKLQAFIYGLQGPSDSFFTWELEDIKRLQDLFYRKHLPAIDEPIDFTLNFPPYQVRSANHDSYIFHSNASDIAEVYKKHGEQLLQQNIRIYQGDNATNLLIKRKATGAESANFLHYNNGITFLCESAQWDGFTRKLTLNKAQVVNGGQTVRILSSASSLNELKNNVSVVVRVITSQGDREFASNVAVNLNNQNRIEPSYLRSNEPGVVQLANALASMGWYLERRESEIENLTQAETAAIEAKIGGRLSDRTIRLKDGTQAYVATYLRLPELAKKNLKLMFLGASDGGYFDRIFNSDLTAEKFVAAHKLMICVDKYVRQFNSLKRRKERSSDWRKDYQALLGETLASNYIDTVDQVIPQSAIFLIALLFDFHVLTKQIRIEIIIEKIEKDFSMLNELIFELIVHARQRNSSSKSWPSLLKSQVFFENVASYLQGRSASSK